MQEEIENRSVTLIISGAKLTGRVLKAAIAKYLAHRKEKKNAKARAGPVVPHGRQTVKQLVGQNAGVSNMEITDSNIKSFDRVARKYGVDYAVKKDRSVSPPKYLVFFKARDADALTAAFTEFTAKTVNRAKNPSVLSRLRQFKDLVKANIPFGKVTIIQGNPGEGKTTLALRLCAACTNRKSFPDMAELEPFNVIYQTAEDGLGDTVKPRLMEAEADLARVLVIDEAKKELSLSDERIEKAIRQNNARLIVLDPLQSYLGASTDMNRANEIRPIIKRLADVAERTGCAVILLGHLNKASGTQAAYRGLGSIDFRAAARSVLLIGRVKKEPNIRVIIHDKSSLAPEGEPMAFSLGDNEGFRWIGRYDITADELLSGKGGSSETKTQTAENLILDMLTNEKELPSDTVLQAVMDCGISDRTFDKARKNLGDRIAAYRVGNVWYLRLKTNVDSKDATTQLMMGDAP